MKNYPVFNYFLVIVLLCIAHPVSADSYGNSTTTPANLTINKMVKNPVSGLYVENLGSRDPLFQPSTIVSFRLSVSNTSGETFHPVEVVDQLPTYLTYISSSIPAVSYDAGTHRIVFRLENLIAGETRVIDITAKVSPRNAFPIDSTIICTNNYAKATAPARPNGDDDTSEFCLTTDVSSVTYLPVAGYNDLFAILPFLSLGGIGIVMMKKRV